MIDFLRICKQDFSKNKLVIFYGDSGSGKSTYLQHFYKVYENDTLFQFHKEQKIHYQKTDKNIIFLDEIVSLSQFFIVRRFLQDKKQVFIASHIHPVFFILFFPFSKKRYFFTNKNNKKIETILQEKGYRFSKRAIEVFIKNYHANFTRLDIILETSASKNFDVVLENFERNYKMEHFFPQQ